MEAPRRSIFREEAIRRYREGQARPVAELPVVPRRVVATLWLLLGLLLAVAAVCWFVFEVDRWT